MRVNLELAVDELGLRAGRDSLFNISFLRRREPRVRPRRERASVSYREIGEGDVYADEDEEPKPSKKRKQPEAARSPDDAAADECKHGDSSRRRSGRVTTKEAPIDAIVCTGAEAVGAPDLSYTIGGAEAGGTEATKILGEVETDEGLLQLS